MPMKPWMPLLAATALAVSLVGCGNGDDEPAAVEQTQEAAK